LFLTVYSVKNIVILNQTTAHRLAAGLCAPTRLPRPFNVFFLLNGWICLRGVLD